MKLRTRLLAMLLITCLIPIIIFSAVSISQLFRFSQENTYQLSSDKLEIAKAEISGMLDKHFNTLQTIAQQPAIRSMDLQKAKSILVDAVKVNPDLMLTLDNANGDQLVKSNDDALTSVSERDFYQQAMSGNEAYVSDVIITLTTNEFIVVIATPVRDMNNKIVGVLQANVYLAQLSEFVTELSAGGSNVYILSRKGAVLAHPNLEYVQNQEDFSSLEFVQTGLAGGQSETLETTNFLGDKVIVSYYRNDLSGWLIVVETPVSVASAYGLLNITCGLMVAAVVIVTLLGLYFSRRFTKPVVQVSSVIKAIAQGELKEFETKSKSKDEIGELYRSLQTMTQNLRGLVGNIQNVTSGLASHSTQLSSISEESSQSLGQVVTTINEMAQGNSTQALVVQSSAEAMVKVNEIVSLAAVKTEAAAGKAKESMELAQEGQKALEQQSQSLEENTRYTGAVDQSIQQLAAMTEKIRNIVGVINNIAVQTTLLALNASIEAARAGGAGRGFAVLANEIRGLAERCKDSTKEIEEIVNSISGSVTETVGHMNRVRESVLVMESSAANTKESFSRIFASITDLAQIAYDVSAALEEINHQTEEVTEQATGIAAVVEKTAAGMQEISAASEQQLTSIDSIAQSSGQLGNMAQELLQQVTAFKIQ